MLQTIPVINNKGGVGKTTTTVNLACGMARRGKNVLLVDLDSQGSASLALGVDRSNLTPSTAEVLFRECRPQEAIRSSGVDNLDLLTGSLSLANADTRLADAESRETRLRESLNRIEDRYDLIFIDCAPSTSLLSINALTAADAFIVPVSPSYLSLEGVVSLGKVVNKVRLGLGEAAPILGLVLTMIRQGDEEAAALAEKLRSHYGGKVFDTEIRYDTALEDAPARQQSIFDYAPQSEGAEDYRSLLDEVESRLERYASIYGTVRGNQEDRAEGHTTDPSVLDDEPMTDSNMSDIGENGSASSADGPTSRSSSGASSSNAGPKRGDQSRNSPAA